MGRALQLALLDVPALARGGGEEVVIHEVVEYLQGLEIFPLILDMHTLRDDKLRNFGTAGAALDGELSNTVIARDGALGGSTYFNGTTSVVKVPNHSSINALNAQEWVFLVFPLGPGQTNSGALAIWENGVWNNSGHAILFINNDAALESLRSNWRVNSGNLNTTTSTGITVDSAALLFSEHNPTDNHGHMYHDAGVEYAYSAQGTRDGTADTQTGDLYIGNRKNLGQTWYGAIYLVACATRALTPTERTALSALVSKGGTGSSFVLTADADALTSFGLAYPLTYQFSIPADKTDLYVDVDKGAGWEALPVKTAADFFNGIDAVRFDYDADKAYVSVAIGATQPTVAMRFKDAASDPVTCTYEGITKYYDNRAAAVTLTADDWRDTYNDDFVTLAGKTAALHLWLSPGVITGDCSAGTWTAIQAAINAGYCEPVSHTRIDTAPPYAEPSDYVTNIGGAVEDLNTNLTMPTQNRRGTGQYHPGFITPGGADDSYLRSILADYGHLTERDTQPLLDVFYQWDFTDDIFAKGAYSIRIGSDGEEVLATLNAKFDAVYAAGGVYHLMSHPYNIDYVAYGDDHLAYIADKTDVWYVAFGHLVLYRYCTLFSKVAVEAV